MDPVFEGCTPAARLQSEPLRGYFFAARLVLAGLGGGVGLGRSGYLLYLRILAEQGFNATLDSARTSLQGDDGSIS
jgi:hypothetical protein